MSFLTGESVSIVLFFIGIAGMVRSRRMLKTILSYTITEVAVILFFLSIFADPQDVAPIATDSLQAADPLPQALMITAIVIGVAVTALALVLFINLYHVYGTSDWEKVQKKRMELLK